MNLLLINIIYEIVSFMWYSIPQDQIFRLILKISNESFDNLPPTNIDLNTVHIFNRKMASHKSLFFLVSKSSFTPFKSHTHNFIARIPF